MTAGLTQDQAISLVERAHDSSSHAAVIDTLRSATNRLDLARGLAHARNPLVRMWIAVNSPEVLGRDDAYRMLTMLSADSAPDVSDEAIRVMLDTWGSLPPETITTVERKLSSEHFYESIAAVWTIARLRGSELAEALQRTVAHPKNPSQQRAAAVALMLSTGQSAEVLTRLRNHDHELTTELAHAASLINTDEARAALELCASTFDADCAGVCRWTLETAH